MREYRDRRGFTLVEVLIALAILAIGIMGVTLMVPRALEQGRKAVAYTRSANRAETMFSQYRAKGFRTMYGKPTDRFQTLPGVVGDNIARTAEIYHSYGWQDDPLVQSRVKFTPLHYARTAGLYKMCVTVPLVGGGRASYVTYLARE